MNGFEELKMIGKYFLLKSENLLTLNIFRDYLMNEENWLSRETTRYED